MKKYLFTLISLCSLQATAAPHVVSSIYPLQQIANAVSGEKTDLIADTYLSPHDYHVTPSDAKKILDADLLIVVGETLMPQLENYLEKRGDKTTIEAMQLKDIHLLKGGHHHHGDHDDDEKHDAHADHEEAHHHDEDKNEHEEHKDEHEEHHHKEHDGDKDEHHHEEHEEHEEHADEHEEHHHDEHSYDPHVWLSPKNANVIAIAIAEKLSAIDPENKATYADNLKAFQAELEQSANTIKKQLNEVEAVPYFVFHNAYRYFEDYFGLTTAGVIRTHVAQSVRTKHIAELKKRLDALPVACLFREPQFKSNIVDSLSTGNNVVVATLDPVGYSKPAQGYTKILSNIADTMVLCSQGASK